MSKGDLISLLFGIVAIGAFIAIVKWRRKNDVKDVIKELQAMLKEKK